MISAPLGAPRCRVGYRPCRCARATTPTPFTTLDGSEIRVLLDARLGAPVTRASPRRGSTPGAGDEAAPPRQRRGALRRCSTGSGEMDVDGDRRAVTPGDAILIPPGAGTRSRRRRRAAPVPLLLRAALQRRHTASDRRAPRPRAARRRRQAREPGVARAARDSPFHQLSPESRTGVEASSPPRPRRRYGSFRPPRARPTRRRRCRRCSRRRRRSPPSRPRAGIPRRRGRRRDPPSRRRRPRRERRPLPARVLPRARNGVPVA